MKAKTPQRSQRAEANLSTAVQAVKECDLPAQASKREERIELRVSPSEKRLIQSLAEACGVSVTALLVTLAESAAERLNISPH